MKNVINNFISYAINLMLAMFLSFSIVYAIMTALSMTYNAKDIVICVCCVLLICGVAFGSNWSVKISAVALVFSTLGALIYFLKKPFVFKPFYSKAISSVLWFMQYLNHQVPLNMLYQKYIFFVLAIGVSLVVYVFAVKKFNFYVLLIIGTSLFAVQWILEYFVSYVAFYIFVFVILVSYFKHIYLRNTKNGKRVVAQTPAVFLISTVPICALVVILAWYMPVRQEAIQWNWMDLKLKSVQNFIKMRFNIGATEYFTINSTGFSEDPIRLGGNVSLDDTIVMNVDTAQGNIYLKGAVRDLYTGSSWENVDYELTSLGQKLQLEKLNEEAVNDSFEQNSIQITYENLQTKTLFVPEKTKSLTFNSGALNILMDSYGMPSSEKFVGKGFKYSAELYNINQNNESIAKLLSNSTKASSDMHNRYIQLPAQLPKRVGALALDITSSAKNDYDRVKAIEAYVAQNYTYTLEPGAVPKDRDFVDYFLFDVKQGYCTYYASAMVVLTRSLGIPARYVEGYVLPSQPISGTTFEVTNKQAHAWVEVYFKGFGWIAFEPTAPRLQNLYNPSEQNLSGENSVESQANTEQNELVNKLPSEQEGAKESEVSNDTDTSVVRQPITNRNGSIGAQTVQFKRWIVLAITALMMWVIVFSPIKRKFWLHKLERLSSQQHIIEMYRHFLKVFSIQGLQIKPGETPLQYANRIDQSMQFESSSFKVVTDVFIKARYSNMPIDEKQKQLVIQFYSIFLSACKVKLGLLKYFIYNNLLGWI